MTSLSYLIYPIYIIYKAKNNNQKYPAKKIKKIGIINAVIVCIIWILLGGSGGPAFFWGWIAYNMMMDRIVLNEDNYTLVKETINNSLDSNITNTESKEKSFKNHDNTIAHPFETVEQPTPQKQTVKITIKRKSTAKKPNASQEQVHSELPITPVVDNEIKFCRKCGAKLEKGSIYCIKCGSKI